MENFQSGANEHKLEIVDAEFCIFMRNVSDQDNFQFRYYISRIFKEVQDSWIGQFKEEYVLCR